MAIYTKTGDKEETSTFAGKRISKSSKLIAAIGAIDELNSFLGVIGGLTEIQKNLFTINAILTGAKLEFPLDATKKMERQIDKWEGTLPVLKNFIYYGGAPKASQLFYARALCRRAERELVSLKLPATRFEILIYLNRLSDYLFMLARSANHQKEVKETFWKGSK